MSLKSSLLKHQFDSRNLSLKNKPKKQYLSVVSIERTHDARKKQKLNITRLTYRQKVDQNIYIAIRRLGKNRPEPGVFKILHDIFCSFYPNDFLYSFENHGLRAESCRKSPTVDSGRKGKVCTRFKRYYIPYSLFVLS